MAPPFEKLLVANRGEIARRVIRTAKRLGIHTIAVCSEADADALFAQDADESHVIGPPPPKDSYLKAAAILAVAKRTGAQAIHPGYGFLAENAAFARAVADAGLVFVGPPPEAMDALGSKLDARKLADAAGVPIIPGSAALATLDEAKAAADLIGYPLLLKASAGGGGIGMQVVKDEKRLERAFEDVKKKGGSFFGDDTAYIEKLVERPAHVEVQILCDSHGNRYALGERDCTVQRRNQKVLEETPSTHIDDATRTEMCQSALRLAEAAGYVNAGTVEMIVSQVTGEYYFLEVNARLQVEHPITELVTGIDLVEAQLRIAAGEAIEAPPAPSGHAIEARICAEDPDKRFFPSPGTISVAEFPDDVRVDSGVASGSVVTPYYDSLLAKIAVRGETRAEAIAAMQVALSKVRIEGIKTNVSAFETILTSEAFVAGNHDTNLLKDLGYKY